MRRYRSAALVLALATFGGLVAPAAASAAPASRAVSTLTEIRAAHHRGFDRLVFQFSGPVPAHRIVRYVHKVIGDFSGRAVLVKGMPG